MATGQPDWGFFGHRLINRIAVYTLPTEMIGWYKPHIDYLAEHAVDPDKRRYATRHEAVRHYMDLDHWGKFPFDHIPRYWARALAVNLELYTLNDGDTTYLLRAIPFQQWDQVEDESIRIRLVNEFYLPHYYDDAPSIQGNTIKSLLPESRCNETDIVFMRDAMSEHGILPYHLQAMQQRLTKAFREENLEAVMRVSAEIGHYIGDACVPLHTTKNYNGQLTNQVGIHAFWESRIPELFALEEFDMIVGVASYMEDPVHYYWQLVLDSHRYVDDVLSLERELSATYASDKQFCFEERLHQTIKTQCTEYARAYHLSMDKMVEDRFRVAVKALGDAWYTAWVDAGQPIAPLVKKINKKSTDDEEVDRAYQSGKIKGREHDN